MNFKEIINKVYLSVLAQKIIMIRMNVNKTHIYLIENWRRNCSMIKEHFNVSLQTKNLAIM